MTSIALPPPVCTCWKVTNPACPIHGGKAYVWAWSSRPIGQDRKGQRCRVLARGAMTSALIQFESDGYQVVTSRNGLRRAP